MTAPPPASLMPSLAQLTQAVLANPADRLIIAIAGAPASGKSTLAEAVTQNLLAQGKSAALVPMDGFHLDNRVLAARGLLARKGAPETFDAPGFLRLVQALRDGRDVIAPVFDRDRDLAIAGAAVIPGDAAVVVVEGNYLMFDEAPWRALAGEWDLTVRLDVPLAVLQERLIARWRAHGHDLAEARARAMENDIPNARRVIEKALPCDITLRDAG